MGIFYMAGTFCVILMHINRVPESILCMFTAAFTPGAACGGIAGQLTADMFSALRYGVSRGVFSNEEGCYHSVGAGRGAVRDSRAGRHRL